MKVAMTEYIITLTLLIAVVLLLRLIFRKTVSPRVIYALWLVVVVRLCLPFSLFSLEIPQEVLPVSESEVTETVGNTTGEFFPVAPNTPNMFWTPEIPDWQTGEPNEPPVTGRGEQVQVSSPVEQPVRDWGKILAVIWLTGSLVTATWFAITGCVFRHRLHKDRILYRRLPKIKVYLSRSVGSPCLTGIPPAIYITPETAESQSCDLVILHEYVHFTHYDHLWALVRTVAVIVHWWNPVVWLGAFVSRQDSELACDDGVCAQLNEDKRLNYARVLLNSVPRTHGFAPRLHGASIKERLLVLTKRHKNRILCVVLAIALALGAVGCSFFTLNEKETEEETEGEETTVPEGETEGVEVLSVPDVLITEADGLPMKASLARFTTHPTDGMPLYYVFEDGLTYYRYHAAEGETRILQCTLSLPEGYTDGTIVYGNRGGGDGEAEFLVGATRDGTPAWLRYLFDSADTENMQPLVYAISEGALRAYEDSVSTYQNIPIYACDDVYFGEDTVTYGTVTAVISTIHTEYQIADLSVVRCVDDCDPTSVVSRQFWGYAPSWPIDQYEEFTVEDGWNYPTRRYPNIVPEEIASQMREQGAPEEVYSPREYLYLMTVEEGIYAYVSVKAQVGSEKPENEADLTDEIIKKATFTLALDKIPEETEGETDPPEFISQSGDVNTVTLVDALPDTAENARFVAFPAVGSPAENPKYHMFEEGMTYYRHNEVTGEIHRCTLSLPEGYTDGTIHYGLDGGGVGKVDLLVKARSEGAVAWLAYTFDTANEDNLQPVMIQLLQNENLGQYREKMSYHTNLPIYDCGATYLPAAETYGTAIAWIPTALTEYEIRELRILRCDNLCDQTYLISHQYWGFGTAFGLSQYNEFTTAEDWRYPTRRYIKTISDEDGVPSDGQYVAASGNTTREYIYLVTLDENHYAFVVIEPREGVAEAENEAAVVNEFIRTAYFKLMVSDTASADNFEGALAGHLAATTSETIELYTRRDGSLVTSIPRETVADFFNYEQKPGWMIQRFYYGEIDDFRWVLVCSPTAMGEGVQSVSTSRDGGKTWTVGQRTNFTNAVTGAIFLSETVGYISHSYGTGQGPNICRTTDGGTTWERLEMSIPDQLAAYKMQGGIPFVENGLWLYPVVLYGTNGAEDEVFLYSKDGLTWDWSVEKPVINKVNVPLNEENREYVSCAATYGVSNGMSYGDTIGVGTDGVRYDVFGLGSHFRRSGAFSAFYTYRVESAAGMLVSVEPVETITKATVLEKGTPYMGSLDGLYQSKSYNLNAPGLISRSVYIDGDEITVAAYLDGTDAGGTYKGYWEYDTETGAFMAEMERRFENGDTGGPLRITGKLLQYNGLLHFICETSEFYDITPEDPLPLTFVPNIDGSMDAPKVTLDENFGGEWYYSLSDEEGARFYRLAIDTDAGEMAFDYGYFESEYVNRYTGSYTVTPFYEIEATLHDDSVLHQDPDIHMTFSLGYSMDQNGTTLFFILTKCDVEKYGHLIGTTLSFTHEMQYPISTPTGEEVVLRSAEADSDGWCRYTVPCEVGETEVRIPETWLWDGNHFVDDSGISAVYDTVKRVAIYTTPLTSEEFAETLSTPLGTRVYHMDEPITGTTDSGISYVGYWGDDEAEKGNPTRRYLFHLRGEEVSYTMEIWRYLNCDGENFEDQIMYPILRSVMLS